MIVVPQLNSNNHTHIISMRVLENSGIFSILVGGGGDSKLHVISGYDVCGNHFALRVVSITPLQKSHVQQDIKYTQERAILICNPSRCVGELEVKLHKLLASTLEVLRYKAHQRSNLCSATVLKH
jgi:hypothetical protein